MSEPHAYEDKQIPSIGQITLIGLFITALITAQLTAAKILQFSLPFAIPIAGNALILPGAALAYALTFFATDCFSELYGRKAATRVVNIGFTMNFVLLGLVWATIAAPAAPTSIDPAAFEQVLGASINIVGASLIAYVVSQNTDVILFHKIRAITGREKLWMRNIGSTATSQFLDTILFVVFGFAVLPAVFGVGSVLPESVLLQLIVAQYLLKLTIAAVDTPVVYAVVYFLRNQEDAPSNVAVESPNP